MLGTQGGPIPGRRAASATALVVGGAIYLIDAGSGLPLRISEAGLDFKKVRGLFITHLHSDHYIDAFNFFSLNWTNWDYPRQQVQVYGPGQASKTDPAGSEAPGLPTDLYAPLVRPEMPTPGIVEFFDFSISANTYDINERLRTTRRFNGEPMDFTGGSSPALMVPHTIDVPAHANVENRIPEMAPIPVYEDDRVKVSAMLTDHPPVFPAFSFRFETADKTIVFSGDTSPNANLQEFARGADVLVNEVMDIDAATARFAGQPIYDRMQVQFSSAHTPLRDWQSPSTGQTKPGVGTFAHQCGVRSLVLNHVYPGDGSVKDSEFRRDAERTLKRPVVVSDDLMVIDLADLSVPRKDTAK
ncbi:MBL fold metallo-hydrolase [Streptomyces sp. NBC_01618]|uniref:MBL fold metallo-hydrolase n=1 Tax=Streptomyces sp. NBC_01618 TaxID=2975900 RepID=UPI0038708AF0|nr:MBL fold metallo-hydrolase [Streptomyces sp. NBC_01618]